MRLAVVANPTVEEDTALAACLGRLTLAVGRRLEQLLEAGNEQRAEE